MSCRSCGFENMKNSRVCARCGAKLVWDRPVLRKNFRPERGSNTLLGRLDFRRQRLWNRIVDVFSASPLGFMRRIPRENIRRGFASVIPGLGLWMAGQTWHAAGVFAAWTLTLALTVAGIRLQSMIAPYGPGIMSFIHAYAVIAAVRPVEFCRKKWEALLVAWFMSAVVFSIYTLVSYWIFWDMAYTFTLFGGGNGQ
jgi:hypothetical protein